MLAGIPYTTFPLIDLGPVSIRTFGLMVGIGVLVGARVAAGKIEPLGVPRETVYRIATRMVVAGVVGSRITWVLTHLDSIDSPVDVVAVWEGGLQFSGGFIAGLVVGIPMFRNLPAGVRWRTIDGYAYGLTIGLAIGRVGCYAVGEHFGKTTDFALGVTYRGGDTQESTIGDLPLVEGMTFHNTALYELVQLLVLFGLLTWFQRRHRDRQAPGLVIVYFAVWYGLFRLLTDGVRVNDDRVLGLTGAQWMSALMVLVGVWLARRLRRRHASLEEGEEDPAPEPHEV